MKITNINATPRSKVFKYYTTATGGSNSISYSPPSINPDNVGEVVINTIGTGNVVGKIEAKEENEGVLDVTMATRMASLATSGSGNVVGSLSYNTGTGVLTQNMTSGGGISLASTGTGNTVSDLSLSGTTLTKAMNYRVNAVAESADTSPGAYIRCANQYPSITNSGSSSAINFPYKQLVGGAGISISAPSGSSNITISANSTMYTWRYYISSSLTFSAYESKSYQISGHGFSVYAAFPSIIYPSRPATATEANVPFAVRIVLESNLIYFVITNPVDFSKALMGGSYLTALLTSN